MTAPERSTGPALTGRELALASAGGLLLAVVMFWPLVLHVTRDVPKDLGDPLLVAWDLAWGRHALLSQPLDFWQGNIFWPNPDSFAFADSLVGYLPLSLLFPGGVEGAIARYDVLFLVAYAVAFTGPYALARELGLPPWAAVLAGVAFAYSPWRWEQSGHLHVISSGAIPLSLAFLLRGYRHARPRAVLLGWALAAWQFAIGVSLGLMLAYTLAALAVFVLIRWLRAGRPAVPRQLLIATAAGVAIFAAVAALIAPAYLRVRDHYPESRRGLPEVAFFSPPARAFLTAPADNPVWGGLTEKRRATLTAPAEQTLFPGALTLALAALGLALGPFSRRMRVGLLVTGLLTFEFSMGLAFLDGRVGFRLLYDFAPGWDGSRTPGRLHTLTTLVLALLAAAGVAGLVERVSWRGPPWLVRGAPVFAAGLLAALVCVEGSAFRFNQPGQGFLAGPAHPAVTPRPPGLDAARDPVLHLPPGPMPVYHYVLWSVDGFPRTVNGLSGFEPRSLTALLAAVQGFPDAASVAALRDYGVRSVVLHPPWLGGTPWAGAAAKPLDGLAVRRQESGGVVVFDLGR